VQTTQIIERKKNVASNYRHGDHGIQKAIQNIKKKLLLFYYYSLFF
jgi:hypothetical protein